MLPIQRGPASWGKGMDKDVSALFDMAYVSDNTRSDETEMYTLALKGAIAYLSENYADIEHLGGAEAANEKMAIAILAAGMSGERDVARLRDIAIYTALGNELPPASLPLRPPGEGA